MDSLRRVGGEMEQVRRPAGPRALLPSEVEMCEVLGITEDDYWMFVDLAQARNGERREGYELVPDIGCDATVIAVVSLVIGIASTAVSVLLTPKPRPFGETEAPPQLKTADAIGPKRFATQSGFESVQSVASLGEIIPLVFANYNPANKKGGVRVSSRLLWSRMTSWGTTQQFEGIYLFSSGSLAARPDFAGFAIGESLLATYPQNKSRLLFAPDGGRLRPDVVTSGNGQYPETQDTDTRGPYPFNVFRAGDPNRQKADFCSTRTPSSQTQFGLYSPMPNGMAFQLPYELVLIPDGQGKDVKERARTKRAKLAERYPIGAALTDVYGNFTQKGTTMVYSIQGGVSKNYDWGDWGEEDIQQTQLSRRVDIDTNMSIGSAYLVGSTPVICIGTSTQDPYVENLDKSYEFEVSESRLSTLDVKNILDESGVYETFAIQRLALATITNRRSCNITEIGIRSNVWKRISFANVNTQPSDETISDFEEEGGNIGLGQVNKYIKRYSFFLLEARKRGDQVWTNLNGPNTLFCIRGNTPQDQYNYIIIEHPYGQHEFRLFPVPGVEVYKFWLPRTNPTPVIYQLRPGPRQGPISTSFGSLYFSGVPISLDAANFYNKEWIVGPNINDLGKSLNPYDALADYMKYDNEESSHSSGPEHAVVYVNEVIYNSDAPIFNGLGPQYDSLAIAGLNLWSDKEWTSLSELSTFIKYGITVSKPSGGNGPTNLLPDIVYALLTDPLIGAGKLIGAEQVDASSMAAASRYCQANNFTWDGVISNRLNLRSWIFENAAYCLLDFTIIGGRFALKPSPITRSDGSIDRQGKPPISALFTDGNIRNLKVAFLEPEDRKSFKAVCLYREDTENGFPQVNSVTVKLSNNYSSTYPEEAGDHSNDPEETFDMTDFYTVPVAAEPTQAITFAMNAIRTRTLVTHSVTFQTTPEMAMGLQPGEYFRLVSEATHTSRFNNGAISDDGVVTSTTPLSDGSYSVYYWIPGSTSVSTGTLSISNGIASNLRGTIYTLQNSVTEDRIYKLESLSYAEDGLVEVTGSHVPLTGSGALAVMDDSGFDVEFA